MRVCGNARASSMYARSANPNQVLKSPARTVGSLPASSVTSAARLARASVLRPEVSAFGAADIVEVGADHAHPPRRSGRRASGDRRPNRDAPLALERQLDRHQFRERQIRQDRVAAILVGRGRRAVPHGRHVVHPEAEAAGDRLDLLEARTNRRAAVASSESRAGRQTARHFRSASHDLLEQQHDRSAGIRQRADETGDVRRAKRGVPARDRHGVGGGRVGRCRRLHHGRTDTGAPAGEFREHRSSRRECAR